VVVAVAALSVLFSCGGTVAATRDSALEPTGPSGTTAVDSGHDATVEAVPGAQEPPPDTPLPCPDLYDPERLPTIAIEISAEEWAAIEHEYVDWARRESEGLDVKPYHPLLSFEVDGEEASDVSIRLRGNPGWSWNGEKMQFAIAFNHQDPDARFQGLRKLVLDAPYYDPSILRERMAQHILGHFGQDRFCVNHARLVVNGDYYGLYANVESPDREALERLYGDAHADGNLYRYDIRAGTFDKKTNESDPDMSDLEALYSAETWHQVEALTEPGQRMAFAAADGALPNRDGFWVGSINFQWYNHPERGFILLPWDLDYALDVNGRDSELDPLGPRVDSYGLTTIFDWGLTDVDAAADFEAQLVLATSTWDAELWQGDLDRWSDQIRRAVADDPRHPVSTAEWQDTVTTLREHLADRPAWLEQRMTCASDDQDSDGWSRCRDCDDEDPQVHPGQGC
jgi:hypothetical protein